MKLKLNLKHSLFVAPSLCAAIVLSSLPAATAAELAPLPLKLPAPTTKGTPEELPSGPNIEPPIEQGKTPKPFMAPKGVVNVAAGKKVTSSLPSTIAGELLQITDGKKEAFDDYVVEMRKGVQWVQVDLEKEYEIAAIAVWHDHRYVQSFRDVILQVSNDPDFTKDVVTLYNNDYDNSAGFGEGKDKEYFEQQFGRVIDGKGTKGRYVRSYTKGSTLSAFNCHTEIEVYALPK
jgi:hypothetical protein